MPVLGAVLYPLGDTEGEIAKGHFPGFSLVGQEGKPRAEQKGVISVSRERDTCIQVQWFTNPEQTLGSDWGGPGTFILGWLGEVHLEGQGWLFGCGVGETWARRQEKFVLSPHSLV